MSMKNSNDIIRIRIRDVCLNQLHYGVSKF